MDSNVRAANKQKIEYIIKNLEKRNMAGYYCDDREAAKERILSLVEEGALVSWGGSATLNQLKIKEEFSNVIDVQKAPPEKAYEERQKSLLADVYLTSTNAITMEGELVNIDGNGNRVAAMCFGPRKVIVVAGVNKIAEDEPAALARIRTEACPPNCLRLGKKTPCAVTGKCGSCLIPEQTICAYTVTTRFSCVPDRIHVVLVNDVLGF